MEEDVPQPQPTTMPVENENPSVPDTVEPEENVIMRISTGEGEKEVDLDGDGDGDEDEEVEVMPPPKSTFTNLTSLSDVCFFLWFHAYSLLGWGELELLSVFP